MKKHVQINSKGVTQIKKRVLCDGGGHGCFESPASQVFTLHGVFTRHRRFEIDQEMVYNYKNATTYIEGRIPSNYAFLNLKCPWRHDKPMRKKTYGIFTGEKAKTSKLICRKPH